MPGTTGFPLDDEQREQVRDCLRRTSAPLVEPFDKFIGRIECSINHYRSAEPKRTRREARDALRAIWFLASDDDPQVAVLRARVRELRGVDLEYIGRRAARVIPRLFPEDAFEEVPFWEGGGFLAWAHKASGGKLVRALRVLSAGGAQIVAGRSRGSGKRSLSRVEPVILGEARGVGARIHKGGRPTEEARLDLVMALGLDWLHATGKNPEPGRSDRTGFGELVHTVFQWLDISEDPYEAATYSLRRFWSLRGAVRP
jgi:hypothetical protein